MFACRIIIMPIKYVFNIIYSLFNENNTNTGSTSMNDGRRTALTQKSLKNKKYFMDFDLTGNSASNYKKDDNDGCDDEENDEEGIFFVSFFNTPFLSPLLLDVY